MNRRRIGLGIFLFLIATTAAAPVAFWIGGRAAFSDYDEDYEASRRPGEFVDMTDALWDCDQFGDFDGLRTYDRVRGCGPGYGRPGRLIRAYYGPSRPDGPLQLATARAISKGSFAPPDSSAPVSPIGDPISAALAPLASSDGPFFGGDSAPPPYVLVSNAPPLTTPDPDPVPDPVPLPGAFALLLSGLAGLGALRKASKNRRRSVAETATGFSSAALRGCAGV
jgi:hypothetical protein